MLRKSLRAIDRVGEEIFDHPIRNAKLLAGTAAACLVLEKLHEGYIALRYPEEQTPVPLRPVSRPQAHTQPEIVEIDHER